MDCGEQPSALPGKVGAVERRCRGAGLEPGRREGLAGAWPPSAAQSAGRGEGGSAWATLGAGPFCPHFPAQRPIAVDGSVARGRRFGMLYAARPAP